MPVWHGESFLQSKHGPWHAGTLSCRAGLSTALKKFSASFVFSTRDMKYIYLVCTILIEVLMIFII